MYIEIVRLGNWEKNEWALSIRFWETSLAVCMPAGSMEASAKEIEKERGTTDRRRQPQWRYRNAE